MKVKSYIADTMQEAMAQVKSELGREAVILNTRKFHKGGFMGIFAREKIEVVAAVDSVKQPAVQPEIKHVLQGKELEKAADIKAELANMRQMMEQMMYRLPTQDSKSNQIVEFLLERDIDTAAAEALAEGIPANLSVDNPIVQKMLHDKIARLLTRTEGISIPDKGCRKVALIGPTGVGKTTTLAKLAAYFSLHGNYKVALITADTYRIAAVEQLRTYADIIGIPIDIVYTSAELKEAIERHKDKDLILIDTAGRSPSNDEHLVELQTLLAVSPYMETHLVLSATTKTRDALQIIKKFAICAPQKLIFTKLDETSNAGTLVNVLYHFPTIVSYVTTGQNVPDDIEPADAQRLAALILGE